ncbi:MAG: hypothetical protein LBD99_02020, partial [Candidatus Margulisbacteria bacterium]|nr:hypothetical protein [Candidatus Margulisiibacteriota bacterium]
NPAGYGLQKTARLNTLFTKNRNIEDVYYLGYGAGLWGGYAAFNVYSSSIADIPVTELDDQNRPLATGESFSAADRAFVFSYGRSLGGLGATELGAAELAWGFSLKYIQQSLYESRASGAGLDAGLLYQTGALRAGWSILNLVEPQMVWDTGNTDTVEFRQRFGLAYALFDSLLISGELVVQKNDTLTGLGLEYSPLALFALRAGTFTDHYVFGLGFNYAGLALDYAYVIPLDYLVEPTQKISLGYVF